MTDQQILENPALMRLLRAVRDGRVIRGGPNPLAIQAPYLFEGEHVRLDVMILRKHDLVWTPISGPPRLAPRGSRLLDIDGRH